MSRPSIGEAEIKAVEDVMRSGWLTTGAQARAFEERFAEFVGSEFAIALTSGTAGMHIVMHCLGIGPGDEVITPSLTWVSTVNLIELMGAKPVFVDVDRDHLMCTAAHIEPHITERTKAIIPVHYAGAACDVDAIADMVGNRPIQIVEDAAHAVGSKLRGQQVGGKHTSVFSFHAIKNLTTGEGGMVCSNDDAMIERLRRAKFHGLGVDAFDRETQGRRPQAMVVEPGFKYNMTDICAALGLVQLERIEDINRARTALAMRYLGRLKEIDGIVPLAVPPQVEHCWHLMVVRVTRPGATREKVMAHLASKGIGSGIHFMPVHGHPYYLRRYPNQSHLGDTEWNGKRIFSLPLFPELAIDDVDRVCDGLQEALKL